MRVAYLAAFVAATAISTGSHAEPTASGSVCRTLADQIEAAQMVLAANAVDGSSGVAHSSEVLPIYAQIQANVALMAANQCAPYTHPITPVRYLTAALDCQAARMKARGGDPAECKREGWRAQDKAQ